MNPATNGTVEGPRLPRALFSCSLCGREAGRLEILVVGGRFRLERRSFTSVLTAGLAPEALPALRAALEAADVRALFALDLEYTPFFCPTCDACYCADHWERWDVFDSDDPSWHDSVRGRCPKGHERMLED